jgi:hypothetical protein
MMGGCNRCSQTIMVYLSGFFLVFSLNAVLFLMQCEQQLGDGSRGFFIQLGVNVC